jgi:hypothetical protein
MVKRMLTPDEINQYQAKGWNLTRMGGTDNYGSCIRPLWALPRWIVDRITK